jgi:hypothetical protein
MSQRNTGSRSSPVVSLGRSLAAQLEAIGIGDAMAGSSQT